MRSHISGFPGGSVARNSLDNAEGRVWSLVWEDPWKRKWAPTQVILPEKSLGLRSLLGYSSWGRKESTWLGNWAHILYYSKMLLFICLVISNFLGPPWIAAHQAPLSSTISRSLHKLASIELVMPSNHLILCCLLFLPSIFPRIRDFSNGLALHIRWLKYWNFSISLFNDYSGPIFFRIDWFDSPPTRVSRVFSNTTVQKHQFFGAQPF